ncbi:divergent PAP2 family protein [Patescibacteria group bacterium]|nr:divergent PAP2 family protein [Patescibacteria group bacterium]
MDLLKDYVIIIVPLLAALFTQAYKLATDQVRGNLNLKEIITSLGGMPSAHTAFVVSLTTIVGLVEGVTSAFFGIAFILMVVVIRDAMGFRIILGDQAKIINHLQSKLPEEEKSKLPTLKDQYGHTITEVLWGALLGIIISLFYYFLVF